MAIESVEFFPKAFDEFSVRVPNNKSCLVASGLMRLFANSSEFRESVFKELVANMGDPAYERGKSRRSRQVMPCAYKGYRPLMLRTVSQINIYVLGGIPSVRGGCTQAHVNSALLVVYLKDKKFELLLVPELWALTASPKESEVKRLRALLSASALWAIA